MKVLLIYPECPESFWSFKYALDFIDKKSAYPPLGLLTVAAMLPGEWEKKLIDMNVDKLQDKDLLWADIVFISAMAVQRESVKKVAARCRSLGVKTVAGGPLFTMEFEEFNDIDHFVLNEAEITLPQFLRDLEKGKPQKIYTTNEKPNLQSTPIPMWELIDMNNYASMSIQYSRGCPYNCEFCDITNLYGRKQRLKSVEQVLKELETIYNHGWRGSVFFVDDNFIGNKKILKSKLLPAIIHWMEKRNNPFWFITEASIDVADDDELLDLMRRAGFVHLFVGIESPALESLKECNKSTNLKRNLLDSIKKIQNYGMQVSGGFIIGFDSDPPSIFEKQIKFIQKSGIVTAMVGLLNAPKGTKLYEKLKKENRLLPHFSGNNTDFSMNFIPKMNPHRLLEGYKKLVTAIYSPKAYYERVIEFFKEFKPLKKKRPPMLRFCYIKAFIKSIIYLGIMEKGRKYYWKLLLKTLIRYPHFLPNAVTFAIYGFHFRKIFDKKPVKIPVNKKPFSQPS